MVARSPAEFSALLNTQTWQEAHLLSFYVYELHQRNLIPGRGQCYGFAPHPTFIGKIDLQTAIILDIIVWQSICAQLFPTKNRGGA
jgi:hypothetical protein